MLPCGLGIILVLRGMRGAMLKLFHAPGRLYPSEFPPNPLPPVSDTKRTTYFIPIYGIGLSSSEGISPSLGIATEPCRFVLTRSMTLFTLVEKAVHYGRAAIRGRF